MRAGREPPSFSWLLVRLEVHSQKIHWGHVFDLPRRSIEGDKAEDGLAMAMTSLIGRFRRAAWNVRPSSGQLPLRRSPMRRASCRLKPPRL